MAAVTVESSQKRKASAMGTMAVVEADDGEEVVPYSLIDKLQEGRSNENVWGEVETRVALVFDSYNVRPPFDS